MPNRRRLARALAAAAMLPAVLLAGPATAADQPPPIQFGGPSGPSLLIDPATGKVGLTPGTGSQPNAPRDFTLDLILFQCGSKLQSDGTVWCGLKQPETAVPTPTPSLPTPAPRTPENPRPEASGDGGSAGPGTPGTSRDGGDEVPAGVQGPAVPGTATTDDPSADQTDAATAPTVHAPTGVAPPRLWNRLDSADDILATGITAFTLLALVGGAGLASATRIGPGGRFQRAREKRQGSILFADAGEDAFDPEVGGPGDRSRLWRVVSGWTLLDRLSRTLPIALAKRAPLTSRILADGAYLRAGFGMLWLAAPAAAFGLGIAAADNADGYPLATAYGLTAALLVLAVLDATAGLAGVVGFTLGMFLWGPGDLGFGPGLRSYLGLAALWFAIPLLASAARPLRRTVTDTGFYRWDRIADGVIAALVSGWAVQGAVQGLPGLSGLELDITADADRLAVLTIAAVLVRVALEEIAAWLFPERLKVVEADDAPEPTVRRQIVAAALRTGVFAFIAFPFIGSCWQFWVGVAMFAAPALLSVLGDRIPNVPRLYQVLPRGITATLVLLVLGSLVARGLDDAYADDPEAMVRYGFIAVAVPSLVFSLLALAGREGPQPRRSPALEFLGTAVLALSVTWVVSGW